MSLKLMTVAEVAEVLRLHPQVIARKLATSQIEGYKIGKDWRVSEEQLLAFLEKHKNTRPMSAESKTLGSFFADGKLKSIPTTRSKRLVVLKHLVSQLDRAKVYSEPELNKFLAGFHEDICTLRREMIMNKLMVRKNGKYKVVTWQPS